MVEVATQVADPEASKPETAGLNIQETQPKAAAEPEPEKPKGKTEADWQAEVDRANARAESLLGNERKRAQSDAAAARQAALLQAIVDHLSDPDADPKSLKDKVANITDETARTVMERQVRDQWLQSIGEALTDAGMTGKEPELAAATELWLSGDKDVPDLKVLFRGFDEAHRVIRKHLKAQNEAEKSEHKKALETEKRRANLAEGILEVGSKGGIPGSGRTLFTRADLANMTPEEYAKNRQYIVK